MRCLGLLSAIVLAVLPVAVSATVVLSTGPVAPLPTELAARARWGGNGFEAVLIDGNTQQAGTILNPAGAPAWQLGQAHDFRLFWNWTTGTLTWQLDFNRDGSFGAGESTSLVRTARIGTSFGFIRLDAASRVNGVNSNAIEINNLRINGSSFGNFTEAGDAPFLTQWFAPASPGPRLRSIEILGQIVFRNTGGNGAFAQERPNLNLSLVGAEPVPETATWALLIAGFGLVGLALRRQPRTA